MEKFINAKQAGQLISQLGEEFVIVKNPDYIHPEFEVYPLAPKITHPIEQLHAIVMDMDGTTTTTESLCLHSLEYMIRKITSRMTKECWTGLDRTIDYPHIIGNSTTRHVEYLIQRYRPFIDPEALKRAYFQAAVWLILNGQDKRRAEEVKNNLINLGCQDVLMDDHLIQATKKPVSEPKMVESIVSCLLDRYGPKFHARTFSEIVRAGIDIYYQRYHEILSLIEAGKGENLSEQILGRSDAHLIEPMPGVGEFLALVKGWLGDEIQNLLPMLIDKFRSDATYDPHLDIETAKSKLTTLGNRFHHHPLKVAVVTSSILYEARVVLGEVFRVLKQQIEQWPVSTARKKLLLEKFTDYRLIYDGFVTASDSSEIRLKPHRDLYSIALHQLGIPKERFNQVIGFEDSESGTIAIRAAGIGLCVAVPFADTQHHDLRAAAFVLKGGLPEALLRYNLFLRL
ncbi:MAG: hypothetical protein ONB31_11180 [candidate division KSB1 bacterium]|nr:hypothetical protein [candidate division KSB1 bacterium]MDZ7334797.1 hypothetical protein [candidate division KSB1 bacterium]